MKIPDSSMPEESYWNSLFNVDKIMTWLNLADDSNVVEIGCGYGTFTIPIAKKCSLLTVYDIDVQMLKSTRLNAESEQLNNLNYHLTDVVLQGTGLELDSVDRVVLFNILHSENNIDLLTEACRILKTGGLISIIHWRKDISTPRGPDVSSRPDKDRLLETVENLDLQLFESETLLEPYHWGMTLQKVSKQ